MRLAEATVRSRVVALAALAFLCTVLLAEGMWGRSTQSITFDETFYLSCGLQCVHDGRLDPRIAGEGVAPLPVMLTYLPALVRGGGKVRPDPWRGELDDPDQIGGPRLLNVLLCGLPLVVVVFAWLYRSRGVGAAVFGGGIVSLSPTIVAHSTLATTDACFAATTTLALAALVWYLWSPTGVRLVAMTTTVSAALTAKYSALFLLPVVAITVFYFRPRISSGRLRLWTSFKSGLKVLALFGCLLVPIWWAFHLFSFTGPLKTYSIEETPDESPWVKLLGRGPAATWFMDIAHRSLKRPAPVAGVLFQFLHNEAGHPTFLMGETSRTGWWYYYPCAFAFKSTPSELIIAIGLVGLLVVSLRRPRKMFREADVTVTVLAISIIVFTAMVLTSRIAIGHRYLILLYSLVAILGADRLFELLANRPKAAATIAAALLIGQAISNAAVAPNWLAYFNSMSGGSENGWKLLVDSNVDWGQDLPRLREELAKRTKKPVAISYFGTALPAAYGVTADPIATLPGDPDDYDLLAVSATHLQGVYVLGKDPLRLFRGVPHVARVGYSIFLFELDTPEKRSAFRAAADQIRTATDEKRKADEAAKRRSESQTTQPFRS